MIFKRPVILVILLLLASCSGGVSDLPDFDEKAWKEDLNGCLGNRVQQLDRFKNVKSLLEGLSQTEITELLGKPDRHELYKRNQKFFYYEITAGGACKSFDPEITHQYLSIRFNATGLAKEVQIMQSEN